MKKHFHFIGIGGIGMGGLASLLLDQGKTVSGSDERSSAMTDRLKEKGAKIMIGHAAQNIEGADCVIYSSAIKNENPERIAAQHNNVPMLKRAQLLAELMNDKTGIAIAGAHGKTTTSSMAGHLLYKAGLSPTTAVGGIIKGLSSNAVWGDGKYFVAEVDESDGSFLYFYPNSTIITNIDREHLDFYKSWENIQDAYMQFIKQTDREGPLIVCGDNEELMAIVEQSARSYVTYGFSEGCDLRAEIIQTRGFITSFQCFYKDSDLGVFVINLPGQHNVSNALACISLGLSLSLDADTIRIALSSYQGVQRRFQSKGSCEDVLVVDDYAHHPTEIQATLQATESLNAKRVVAVFQPHRYSRTQDLWDDFPESFQSCDWLVVTDIYAASEDPVEGVNSKLLCDHIQRSVNKPMEYVPRDMLVDFLAPQLRAGDCVLTLGAGDITQVGPEVLQRIREVHLDLENKMEKV